MIWKKPATALLLLVFLAVSVRLFNLSSPMIDRHHFRQTDTYAIVINLLEVNSDILHPKFFQTPNPSNTEGLYFGEFPLYQYAIYLMFLVFGESLVLARLFTILLTVGTTLGIFAISNRLIDKKTAIAAALAFTLFPSSVFWGRSLSPDVFGLMCFTLSFACLLYGHTTRNFIISSALLAAAVLVKPFYLAFFLVYGFYFYFYVLPHQAHHGHHAKNLITKFLPYALFFLPTIILYVLWRIWAGTFDASTIDPDPPSILHNRQGWWSFWHTSDWITLFFSRHIFGELLTPLGGLLAVAGATMLAVKEQVNRKLLIMWMLSCFVISFIFAWGSWVHDYYLLPWLPVLSILVGYAVVQVIKYFKTIWTEKLPVVEYGWRIGLLGVTLFFVYFLGVKKFFEYRTAFFQPQGYELYSEDYQFDYSRIAQFVPKGETVVSVQKYYSPYVANALRRTSNIMAVAEEKSCPTEYEFFRDVQHLHELKAQYLVFHKTGSQTVLCTRTVLGEMLTRRFELLYEGKEFDLYKIETPVLEVSGNENRIVLTVEFMGEDNQLEVGGIPGTVSTVEVSPAWEKIGKDKYRAEVETSDWLSFKVYWKTSEIRLQTTAWFVDANGFIVKRK